MILSIIRQDGFGVYYWKQILAKNGLLERMEKYYLVKWEW